MLKQQLEFATAWYRSRLAARTEGGFTAVEWMVIVAGVIAIAGIAILAVSTFATKHGNDLNSGG